MIVGVDIDVLIGFVATITAGVALWFFKNTMSRIAAAEKDKVDRKDFDVAVARSETARQEMRQAQVTLFGKVDQLRDHVDNQAQSLRDRMDEKFDELTTIVRSAK